MICHNDLNDHIIVIHDETGKECKILSVRAQMKIKDGIWEPAVTYRLESDSAWNPQVFIKDTASFMNTFSLPLVSKERSNS